MKRCFFVTLLLISFTAGYSQTDSLPGKVKKDWSKLDLSQRSADHLMLQFGYAGWGNAPDSLNIKGFSRTFNAYFFFDFPFKSNPHFSAGLGLGFGSDNIFFKETTVDIKTGPQVSFRRDTVNLYKKMKVNTGYIELPLELRYSGNPENMNKGFKFAIGAKVGLIVDGKVKAKVDRDANNVSGYIYKEKETKFFQGTRVAAIMRVGYGNFTVFGSYTLTSFFKEGQGPTVKPFSIGLSLSGL
jgi:hypothetical protein